MQLARARSPGPRLRRSRSPARPMSCGQHRRGHLPHLRRLPRGPHRGADVAMYRAKDRMGNGCELFNGQLATRGGERLELASALRRADPARRARVHYQPVVDLRTGRTGRRGGAHALAAPRARPAPPGEFIPVAEGTDLIVALGEWALGSVPQARRWRLPGFGGRSIVPVNALDPPVRQPRPAPTSRRALECGTGADPNAPGAARSPSAPSWTTPTSVAAAR